jgi:hypothetical protein
MPKLRSIFRPWKSNSQRRVVLKDSIDISGRERTDIERLDRPQIKPSPFLLDRVKLDQVRALQNSSLSPLG